MYILIDYLNRSHNIINESFLFPSPSVSTEIIFPGTKLTRTQNGMTGSRVIKKNEKIQTEGIYDRC